MSAYVLAEEAPGASEVGNLLRLDHHLAHACSAFLPSPFESATVLVCDHQSPQISVWDGHHSVLTRLEQPWYGAGFAEVYSRCAEAIGFASGGREQRMEALARLDPDRRDERVTSLFRLQEDRLVLTEDWQSQIESWVGACPSRENASPIAAALQSRIGDLVVEFLAGIRRRLPARRQLCVGGSLFYNSCINSMVRRAEGFDEVFVPINPGNAGLCVGGALHASGPTRKQVTPFLGPSYSPEEIKASLDNCKINYQWVSEADAVATAVDALQKGRLVAWCDGPMEWGPRALGARSIVANPFAPYVLDNLNHFLKQRESWRGYALSGLDEAVCEHFEGPGHAPFMECDYLPRDRHRFRHVLPALTAAVRVQTVGRDAPPRFRALLEAFGQRAGLPIVVNTSFNGFREPMVCGPRDAIRVFFGAGIDVLVLGQFVISK